MWIPPGGTELTAAEEQNLEELLTITAGADSAHAIMTIYERLDAEHPAEMLLVLPPTLSQRTRPTTRDTRGRAFVNAARSFSRPGTRSRPCGGRGGARLIVELEHPVRMPSERVYSRWLRKLCG